MEFHNIIFPPLPSYVEFKIPMIRYNVYVPFTVIVQLA